MIEESNPILQNTQEHLPSEQEIQYQINGKTFIVQPVFQNHSPETIGSILLRLMKADLAGRFAHP